jgi:hypothetical protein
VNQISIAESLQQNRSIYLVLHTLICYLYVVMYVVDRHTRTSYMVEIYVRHYVYIAPATGKTHINHNIFSSQLDYTGH